MCGRSINSHRDGQQLCVWVGAVVWSYGKGVREDGRWRSLVARGRNTGPGPLTLTISFQTHTTFFYAWNKTGDLRNVQGAHFRISKVDEDHIRATGWSAFTIIIEEKAAWTLLMALFHCMVWHGTVQYGSLLGVFPLGLQYMGPGTFFSTTSAEVPSDPYHYQNVICKLYWSLIGRRKSSLLRYWTCNTRPNILDPLDLNQHSQWRIGRNFCLNKRTFLYEPKNGCFVVCDTEWKSLI